VKVFSNASAYRAEPDVPILLPEVNPEQAPGSSKQRRLRGWSGLIVTNSNCTSTGMTIALKALQDAFGLSLVFAVSLQALSGAGYPGVASMDAIDNVIPYIGGEEEKVEWEPRKMLGKIGWKAAKSCRPISPSARTPTAWRSATGTPSA
jgi:aspartate-semialdehyde dehydrogenase